MNKQEKFTTRSKKLKVHRANSKTISSYPVRFSTDILFSSLVSFTFCLLVLFCFLFICFLFVLFFCFFFKLMKLKKYILIQIRLCGRVSDKKIFTRPISGNKTTFFGLSYELKSRQNCYNCYLCKTAPNN